jgi:hypothetical protein
MLVSQGNLKLAQDKELRIKDLENSKLLIDQASLSLSVNADERAALDQKFNQEIKNKEMLLSQEKFGLAKEAELRIKTMDEQRLLLNYKQLDLEGKKVLNKSLNDELNQARDDKKLQLSREKFGLAEQTELRIKTLEDKKLIIDQAELDLKTEGQDFSKILSNKKLALEREKLKLNTLGSSFDAKVIDLISDASLMEEYAEGRLGKGEVIRINNAITSYQIGTPVRDEDPKSPTFGKLIPNPRPLDADTIAFINRRIAKGKNGPAGFGLDSTTDLTPKDIEDLVGDVDGPTNDAAKGRDIYDKYANNIIKFDNIEDIKNATGIWNGLARILNVGAETIGFGEIAPKSNQAIADMKALNLVTVLSIQKARSSKDTVFSAKEIYEILPKVSTSQGPGARLFETDSKALRSINSLIDTLQTDVNNQLAALENAPDLETKEEIKQNINVLTGLQNTWQQVQKVYSGDFEGTNTEELSTKSFLRKDED